MPNRRSPNCPALSLSDALERAGKIYQVEGRNPFDGARAVQLMDYNGLNGASRRALGAVRAFGLVAGRGDSLRISDDAVLIIADEDARDQADRRVALLRCLCHNRVFADLQSQFGSRAAVKDLSAYLQKKYGFKPGAASKTAQVYRSSAALVAASGMRLAPVMDADSMTDGLEPEQLTSRTAPEFRSPAQETGSAPAIRLPREAAAAAHAESRSTSSAGVNGSGDESERRHDSFSVKQGAVELSWPVGLTPDELEDLTDWLILEHRKIVREAAGERTLALIRKKE